MNNEAEMLLDMKFEPWNEQESSAQLNSSFRVLFRSTIVQLCWTEGVCVRKGSANLHATSKTTQQT